MSILSLHDASLILANTRILDTANFHIAERERIALVGRNGAGKSTLLKLLQGDLVLDSGQLQKPANLRIAGLTQEVPLAGTETVYHFLVKSLGAVGEILSQYTLHTEQGNMQQLARYQQLMDDHHAWELLPKIDTMATRLGINSQAKMADLSGGMKRRVLLGAALIANPDLLLLDEPTNHLDIEAIEWLESYLKNFSGSLVVVTHDRAFLANVATRIVEIDRGKLYSHECTYETYLDRRESIRQSEQRQQGLFDKKLADEEAWIRTGVKARRTRNEGRVRALKAMREAHKARIKQLGTVKEIALDVSRSGQLVIEAKQINYALANKTLIRDLSLLVTRGDKLGIIGPNGCGKTTLVRLLLGEIKPDSGSIKQGTALNVAYFDQLRQQLQEDKTLMFNVADGADNVIINGKPKHVASYLKDFLFSVERFNQPVSSLSGGERNRLMLAKLLAKPVNFLIMDEPTNDLDIETLELLEQMLIDYSGTLILISHDRTFINQVVTSVLVYEDDGVFNEFVGAYDEYRMQKKQYKEEAPKAMAIKVEKSGTKLSFNEQRELKQLPQEIEKLEQAIALKQSSMAEPGFYQQEAQKITEFSQQLTKDQTLLEGLYARWEELASRE